jgi:hypothetical protein
MNTKGNNISMYYGDFGVDLPITITNTESTDKIKFNIYNSMDKLIKSKTLPYENETWLLSFTQEESKEIEKGTYLYEIVQYRDGILQNTINKGSLFTVE